MAIKRCPYCRSIIEEKDQYCQNCGTQLLFPEDEFIEEDVPGEKVIDLVDEPVGSEVHEGLEVEEPEPLPVTKPSSSFVFPESLTAELPEKPKARKAKKAEEEKVPLEPVAEAAAPVEPEAKVPAETELPPSPPPPARTAAEMPFEEAFSAKPPAPKVPPKAPAPSATRSELFESFGKTPLGASSEEIEDIARIMSSLEKVGKEPAPSPPAKEPRQTSSGPMPFLEREIESLRKETKHSAAAPPAEKKEGAEELKKSASDVPPWAANLKLEPASEEKLDLPGVEEAKPAVPPVEPSSGLDDFFTSIGEPASPPSAEAPASEERAPDSRAWADISDREDVALDSLSDRLGRERRETVRPKARRRAAGGSKLKAKVYDVFFIILCWAVGVWLATKILSVPMMALFEVALVPLLLFLVTLAVAYFFLFLYFLGETLGDRLSSS